MNNLVDTKFITWNANSIKNKIHELEIVINELKVDVIGLCETKLNSQYKLKVPGFKVYRADRNSSSGGVALIIKNNLKHSKISLPKLSETEAVAVEIFI